MATRVTLLHNPGAGFEKYSPGELLAALRKKGWEAAYVSVKEDDFTQSLRDPGDLVVIAGGDGTVGKVAKQLMGRGIPLGLLPLGTANNIATTLGISGKPDDLIAGWDLSQSKPFDVGVINGPEEKTFFLESVGLGSLPCLIQKQKQSKAETHSREEKLEDDRRRLEEILGEYGAQTGTLYLNDKRVTGSYLLMEVMNIRLAGPNLPLAPQADPGDGLLDVVLVRDEEREAFARFLADASEGESNPEGVEVHRAKKLRVEWNGTHCHVDDKVHENASPVVLDIELIPGGLAFLAGRI